MMCILATCARGVREAARAGAEQRVRGVGGDEGHQDYARAISGDGRGRCPYEKATRKKARTTAARDRRRVGPSTSWDRHLDAPSQTRPPSLALEPSPDHVT